MAPAVELARFTGGSFVTDLFFLAKARVIFVAGALAAFSLPVWRPWSMALMALLLLSAALAGPSTAVLTGSPWHYEGIGVLASYLALFAAASSGDYRRLVHNAIALSSLVVTAMAVMEFVGKPYALVMPDWALGLDGMPVNNSWPRGVSGPFGNGNHLGHYAAMVGPLMLGLGFRRRWFLIPAAAMLFCLVASASRGAVFGSFAAITVLATPLLGRAALFPLAIGDSGRLEIWRNTVPMLWEKARVIGRGPGMFPVDYPGPGWADRFVDRPHNVFLQLWHHSGLVAALIFAGGIVCYVGRGIRTRNPETLAIAAGVMGYVGAGMFNDSTPGVAPVFWVLLGLLV